MPPSRSSTSGLLPSVGASGILKATILFVARRSKGPSQRSLSSGQVISRMNLCTQEITLEVLGESMEHIFPQRIEPGQGCLVVRFISKYGCQNPNVLLFL